MGKLAKLDRKVYSKSLILLTVSLLYTFFGVGKVESAIAAANLSYYSLGFLSAISGTIVYTLAWRVLLRDVGVKISFFREWEIKPLYS